MYGQIVVFVESSDRRGLREGKWLEIPPEFLEAIQQEAERLAGKEAYSPYHRRYAGKWKRKRRARVISVTIHLPVFWEFEKPDKPSWEHGDPLELCETPKEEHG